MISYLGCRDRLAIPFQVRDGNNEFTFRFIVEKIVVRSKLADEYSHVNVCTYHQCREITILQSLYVLQGRSKLIPTNSNKTRETPGSISSGQRMKKLARKLKRLYEKNECKYILS